MDKPKDPKPPQKNKKPYTAPVLEKWGTLREITLKVGSTGARDGGKSRNQNRTRP